jgi:hypothetical protein
MKISILQFVQILALVVGVSYNADAQYIKPGPDQSGRPAPYPGPGNGPIRPTPPSAGDLQTRETTTVIELGSMGMQRGTRQIRNLTSDVLARMNQPLLSSLVLLASSDRGQGELDVIINGHSVTQYIQTVPMKRKAIQVDLNIARRDIRSIEIQTSGNILVQSVTVNSSTQALPALDSSGADQVPGRHPIAQDICDVQTAGVANGLYMNYRIVLKGQAIDGGSSLDEIANKLAQLEQAGICRRPSAVECSLGSAGVVNGQWARLVIKRSNAAFAGADTLDELLSLSQKLQDQRLCTMAVHRCELTTAGVVSSGQYFQQRLLVNGEALLGANDLGSLLSQLNLLRRQNICQ